MSLSSAPTRIAVSQCILFTLLFYIFTTLGCTLDEEAEPNFKITKRAFFVLAGLFFYPLISSLVLLYGILKQKMVFVRTWLISSIILTVILLFVLLSGAIYVAVSLEIYWGIILCAMPFILAFWMAEGIIVVSTYYKGQECGCGGNVRV